MTFTIEVDVLGDGTWVRYGQVEAAAGRTTDYAFPAGYAAHWVRLTASRACKATATFTYE